MGEAGALGVGHSLHEGMGLAHVEIFPVCLAPSVPRAYGQLCPSGRMLIPLILPNPRTSPPHCDTGLPGHHGTQGFCFQGSGWAWIVVRWAVALACGPVSREEGLGGCGGFRL